MTMKRTESKDVLDSIRKHLPSGKVNNFPSIKERLNIMESPARSGLPRSRWVPSIASGSAAAFFLIVTILSLAGNVDDGKESANPISAMMMSIIRDDKAMHLPVVFGLLFLGFAVLTIIFLKKVRKY